MERRTLFPKKNSCRPDSDAERLLFVWRATRLSWTTFAHLLGLPDSKLLLEIAKRGAPMPTQLAARISAQFPQVYARWLRTGKLEKSKAGDVDLRGPIVRSVVTSEMTEAVVVAETRAVKAWRTAKAKESALAWEATRAWIAWEKACVAAAGKARRALRSLPGQ